MSLLADHAQQTAALPGTGHPRLPRVNLLPPEIAEQTRFRRVQIGLGSGLLATVAAVVLLYVAALGSVGDAQGELQAESARGIALQAQTAEYAEVEAVYARAAAAQAMLTQAMGEEVRFSQYLNDLSLTVPDRVWLKSLTFSQMPPATGIVSAEPGIGTVTFSGTAYSHDDVAVWLESLARQKGYEDPYFTNSTKALIGTRPTVNFESTVTLTPAALSGRYTAPAGG